MPNTPIDFPDAKFDPGSSKHIDFIHAEIKAFKEQFKKIKDFDLQSLIPPGVTASTALWYITYLGPVGFIAITAACSLATLHSHQHSRPHFEDPYQNQLARLVETYKWCKSAGSSITNNATFNELATLLSPLLEMDDLMLWEKSDPLSDDFKKIILAKDSHFQFETKKEEYIPLSTRIYQSLFSSAPTQTKTAQQNEKKDTQSQLTNELITQAHKTLESARKLAWHRLYSYKPHYERDKKKDQTTLLESAGKFLVRKLKPF